jgi:glycosyltransferase involved in cell wall biosynthesis
MAEADYPLLASIKALNISYQVLPITSKFGLMRHVISIFAYLIKNRPTVIIASGQYATLASIPLAFLLRIRNRIHVRHHSNFHHKENMRLALSSDLLMNFFSTKIVAVSRVVSEILIQKELVPSHKVALIHNGVDLKNFRQIDRNLNDYSQEFRVGVISRLTEWKGVEYTAGAFEIFNTKYPNSYLHIVGAPADSLPAVENILNRLPSENYEIESINWDMPGFLKSINVLVHVPLEPEDEAFGLVYIEALASTTPSIFTISGVLNELEDPERYFAVVPSRDSNSIFQKLEEYYLQKNVYEEIPIDWLSQFSLQKQGLAYLKLLEI